MERKANHSEAQEAEEEAAQPVEHEQQDAEGESAEEQATQAAETEVKSKAIKREKLTTKARKYLESAERGLLNHIGKALGVPYHAKRETLQPMIQQLSDEYLSTGTISQESMDKLFEEACFSDFFRRFKSLLLRQK